VNLIGQRALFYPPLIGQYHVTWKNNYLI